MAKHGIRYKERKYKDGTKYVLDECPFNSNHRAPDSAIFELNSGAIGFKCLHNSCAGRTWQDVRVLFEPTAYEQQINDRDRQIEEGWRRHNAERQKIIYRPITEETPESPMFQTAEMILSKPEKRREFVKTGITMIDRNLMGLEKGCVSLVSGLRGSAKSTLLGEITLSAIDAGSTVLVYSGELTDTNYMRWLYLQAAGKNHFVQSAEHARFFYVPDEVKKQIAGWMGSRLWLYNNEHGNNFQRILIALTAKAQESRADLIIIDNLMALELDGANTDKYEAQKRFIWSLESLAKLSNTHIVFVAHPRKAMGFLRLDDVSGSGDLSNAVDNAFIIHRNNHDFQKFTRQEFGWKPTDDIYTSTNVIEICKNRDLGAQDEFIPLWFEESTKRLKNELTEYKHFGWEENIEFICADAGKAAETLAKRELHPEAVVVDPPRKGMDEKAIHAIASMQPDRVVYVSCNPATLARDILRLSSCGYTLQNVTAVDMFPRTSHVETVCCLYHQKDKFFSVPYEPKDVK